MARTESRTNRLGSKGLTPYQKQQSQKYGKQLSKSLGLQDRDAGIFKSVDHNLPFAIDSYEEKQWENTFSTTHVNTKTKERLTGLSGKWKGGVADPTKLFSASYEGTDDPYYLFKAQGVDITADYRAVYETRFYKDTALGKQDDHTYGGEYMTTRSLEIERDHTTRESMLDYERSARTAYASSFFQEF